MKKLLLLTLCICFLFSGCGAETVKDTSGKDSSTYSADDFKKYVTLSNYKNVSINWEDTTPASLLKSALANATPVKNAVTDRAVKNGDTVNIDYKGTINGKEFSGGTSENQDLEIGSNSFIEGFEEGLIGKKVGETTDLNLTFPKAYKADLAGKKVKFVVKINSISESSYSENDIAVAKESVFGRALIYYVIENSKFKEKLPSDIIDNYSKLYTTYYTNYVKNNGYSDVGALLKANNATSEMLTSTINDKAIEQTKMRIVLNTIANIEDISVNDSDYYSAVNRYAAANSTTASQIKANNTKEDIQLSVLQDKVEAFLASKSVLK